MDVGPVVMPHMKGSNPLISSCVIYNHALNGFDSTE